MYEAYWKLRERPFDNTPDPRFLYYSQKHSEALSRLLYAVREGKGAAIITGEYGSGKTLLSRVLLGELSSEHYNTALIFNPVLSPLEFIKEVVYQLGGDITHLTTKTKLLHCLNTILYENKNNKKNTVIVVDEAQAIPRKSMEEVRLLLNFQLNECFLFTLILLGQPELKAKIDKLPQLKQRLSVRYHLKALTSEEIRDYIRYRLKIAGTENEVFLEDSLEEIYRFSGGIPRKINNICDMALLVGCGEKLERIGKKTVVDVVEDLEEVPAD